MITDDAEFTVAAKRQRTPVIAELLLRPAGAPMRYQPGQYVLLGDPDGGLVVRSYSIATRRADQPADQPGTRRPAVWLGA